MITNSIHFVCTLSPLSVFLYLFLPLSLSLCYTLVACWYGCLDRCICVCGGQKSMLSVSDLFQLQYMRQGLSLTPRLIDMVSLSGQ